MEPIQVAHRFRTLANRGFITPLECSQCKQELTIRVNEKDEPLAQCFACGYVSTIGLSTILLMERTIAEYERRQAWNS